MPNRRCYVIICLFPLWCYFSLVSSYDFLNGKVERRRWRSKVPIAEDGGKTFLTKTPKKRLLVCEGSQEECFSSLYWRALCFFPKLHSNNVCSSCVYLIRLILFMAHFFASNWESKKTILLLVLLLNSKLSVVLVFFFSRIIVQTDV